MPYALIRSGSLWSEPGTAVLGTRLDLLTTEYSYFVPGSTTGACYRVTGTPPLSEYGGAGNAWHTINTAGGDILDIEFTSYMVDKGAFSTPGTLGLMRITACGRQCVMGDSDYDLLQTIRAKPTTTTPSTAWNVHESLWALPQEVLSGGTSPTPRVPILCVNNVGNIIQYYGGLFMVKTAANGDLHTWRIRIGIPGGSQVYTGAAGNTASQELRISGFPLVYVAIGFNHDALTGGVATTKLKANLQYMVYQIIGERHDV